MISEERSINNETKPSAQTAGGISRSREKWVAGLLFCTDTAYRCQSISQRATTSVVGPNRLLEVGQSMSALPEYFRRQLVPLLRGHHLPRCRDISPCFRSWYVRAGAGRP